MKPARGSDPVRPFCHAGEGYPCADCPRIGAPAGADRRVRAPAGGTTGGTGLPPAAGGEPDLRPGNADTEGPAES